MATAPHLAPHLDVSRRHDFVLLFDVMDGNPNGDPDADNLPRMDHETRQGLVTDVALKRKVRDWVDVMHGNEAPYKIYVQHRGILANEQRRAFEALGKGPTDRPDDEVRAWMCKNFYDIRMFGAVMTVGKSGQKRGNTQLQWNAGQVRGPLQLTFARSIDPIAQMDMSITRVALTNADDARQDVGEDQDTATSGQMGRKAIVPYALYKAYGFFNARLAAQTGVSENDLAMFWKAVQMMWDNDHSAARGLMGCRGLYIFSHDSAVGEAPAHQLFDRVQVRPSEVAAPRSFGDYSVMVSNEGLPAGVTLTSLVG